nr:aconitase X catalytic domain-containing protein [Desulfurococcales archaeon]
MYLTREEEEMLRGDQGEAKAFALRVIIKVGEALGADRLVKIRHAHISGASYSTIGDAGLEFIESLLDMGARVSVPSTMNPIGFEETDPEALPFTTITPDYYEAQTRILRAMIRMGVDPILTCTPYYTDLAKRYGLSQGDHVSWGESSAVLYANSILGLRTNREGGPLALMSAITGLTYYSGLHTPEGRAPKRIYTIANASRELDEAEAGVLGELIAKIHPDDSPPIVNTRFSGDPSLREFMAALGTAGPLGMVYIPGVTPEKAPVDTRDLEKIEIDYSEIRGILEDRKPPTRPDIVYIGCPHAGHEDLL